MGLRGAAELGEVQALAITLSPEDMDRDVLLFFSWEGVRRDFRSPGTGQVSGTSLEGCLCHRVMVRLLPEEE